MAGALVLVSIVVIGCCVVVVSLLRCRQQQVNRRRERLRTQLLQLAAERQIQAATQDAVRRMLAQARDIARRGEPR